MNLCDHRSISLLVIGIGIEDYTVQPSKTVLYVGWASVCICCQRYEKLFFLYIQNPSSQMLEWLYIQMEVDIWHANIETHTTPWLARGIGRIRYPDTLYFISFVPCAGLGFHIQLYYIIINIHVMLTLQVVLFFFSLFPPKLYDPKR